MSTAIFEPVRKKLETKIITDWASQTPIKLEGVAFDQPKHTAWISFTVKFGLCFPAGMGGLGRRLTRQIGVIGVQCFTPANGGTAPALRLADNVANIFRYIQLTDGDLTITLGTPGIQAMEARDKDLVAKLVTCEFQADGLF
jgi:hypothetical protein